MDLKDLNVSMIGLSPYVMAHCLLANPVHPLTRAFKKFSQKRGKTDQDHRIIGDFEWLGSCYTDEPIELVLDGYKISIKNDPVVRVNADWIWYMLQNAAGRKREKFKAGIFIEDEDCVFRNGTDNKVRTLFQRPEYRISKIVKQQKNRVLRTKALFVQWRVDIRLRYLTSVIDNDDTILTAFRNAGALIGFGDFRPKFGRFRVEPE